MRIVPEKILKKKGKQSITAGKVKEEIYEIEKDNEI